MKLNPSILIALMTLSIGGVKAQELKIQASSKIEVSGTSTLHDWTEEVETVEGSLSLALDGESIQGQSMSFTIPVESLKSGNSTMDDNTYKALNSKDHPNITFSSNSVRVIPLGGSVKIEATGTLSIGGGSQNVTLVAIAEKKGDQWECHGSKKIKMTDYGIDPPTAMFGTIKTGDDLNITYQINFK